MGGGKMKITVIAPITKRVKGTDGQSRNTNKTEYTNKKCITELPCEFEFSFIENGPFLMLNAYDQAYALRGVVERAVQAEAEGADAIVINCTADTGLAACREAVSIPVIGPTESTFLYSTQFTDRISVITGLERINGRFYKMARKLGMAHRLTCARAVQIPEGGFKDRDGIVEGVFDVIRDIYETTGCDSFMLGCSDFDGLAYMLGCPGLHGLEEALLARLEHEGMKINFYKPFDVAVYQAYISILMNAKSSRSTYPAPHTLYTKQ